MTPHRESSVPRKQCARWTRDQRTPRPAACGGTTARPSGSGYCHRGRGLDKKPIEGDGEKQTKMPRLCSTMRGFCCRARAAQCPEPMSSHFTQTQRHKVAISLFPHPSLSSSPVWGLKTGCDASFETKKDTIIIPRPQHLTRSSTIRHEQLLQLWSSGPTATTATTATATISKSLRRPSP